MIGQSLGSGSQRWTEAGSRLIEWTPCDRCSQENRPAHRPTPERGKEGVFKLAEGLDM